MIHGHLRSESAESLRDTVPSRRLDALGAGKDIHGCPGILLVIIRAHAPQAPLLMRMVKSLADGPASKYGEQCVRFLLVPTEVNDLHFFQQFVRDVSDAGVYRIQVPPNLTPDIYKTATAKSLENTCGPNVSANSSNFVNGICEGNPFDSYSDCVTVWKSHPEELFKKMCVYSNFVHYYAVDCAIDYAIQAHQNPKIYLLVTNGDNEYDGSFFDKTVTNASANEVVVGVDFENRGHRITAAFDHVSNIELGSAVANLQVIRESGVRFLTSVPQHNSDPDGLLRARAMHDLDFWWFHKLLNISDHSHKIIHEVLFYHH